MIVMDNTEETRDDDQSSKEQNSRENVVCEIRCHEMKELVASVKRDVKTSW